MNAFKVKQRAVSCSGHLLLGASTEIRQWSEGSEFLIT